MTYSTLLAIFIAYTEGEFSPETGPLLPGLLFLALVGFPPFPLFLAKLYLVFGFCSSQAPFPSFLVLGLLLGSILGIVMYFRQYMCLYVHKFVSAHAV